MKFKKGVDPRYLSAPAWYGLWKCDEVYRDFVGRDAVCTSTGEGRHSTGSKHYTGEYQFGYSRAFDLRIWVVPNEKLSELVNSLRRALGEHYQVVFERTHIHVEWEPRYVEAG